MRYRQVLSWIVIITGWQIASIFVGNSLLLPSFTEVLLRMISLMFQSKLYSNTIATLVRVVIGCGWALVFALLTGISSGLKKNIREWLTPLITLSKTIPNITYMFMVLVWLGSEGSVTVIVFLILFPVLYSQILSGMMAINPELLDVSRMYPETFLNRLTKVILPMLWPSLMEGIKTALSLGFKVGVMAEILGQVQTGIGQQLYLGRINLDMVAIFAWTGWMILLSVLIDFILNAVITVSERNR